VHALPHVPQLFGSVSTSLHPVRQHDSPPVQSGAPWHVVGVVHTEPTHDPLAQTTPHPPQLFGSDDVVVHPLVQHVCPTEQSQTGGPHPSVEQHSPPWQSPVEQTFPQTPQLFGSVSVFVQPALQHWSPSGQELQVGGGGKLRHALLRHDWPARQTIPHPPQLLGSDVVSVHPFAQHVSENVHPPPAQPGFGAMHAPWTHDAPVGQTLPQKPQLFGSRFVFAVQPESLPASLPASSITHTFVVGLQVAPGAQSVVVAQGDPPNPPSSPWRDDREQPAKSAPRASSASATANDKARDGVIKSSPRTVRRSNDCAARHPSRGGREAYTQGAP
jgi:hypothetical protein